MIVIKHLVVVLVAVTLLPSFSCSKEPLTVCRRGSDVTESEHDAVIKTYEKFLNALAKEDQEAVFSMLDPNANNHTYDYFQRTFAFDGSANRIATGWLSLPSIETARGDDPSTVVVWQYGANKGHGFVFVVSDDECKHIWFSAHD